MASDKTLLYYGALLHDVGRVIYRAAKTDEAYPQLGARFLEDEVASRSDCFAGPDGQRIVEQIRHQRAEDLRESAGLAPDSLAYVTWFADLVASGVGRGEELAESPTNRDLDLRKIFNRINGLDGHEVIAHEDYASIQKSLADGLAGVGISPGEVGSVLAIIESCLSTVPASTSLASLTDVPLFEHAKITAGIASCAYEYLREQGIANYRDALFADETADGRDMFLLYSCDMSGIQSFIYNISGRGALKQLRARSMYLEIMMEHIVDELLDRLALNRTNLLYTGGGHAYLLLPNTNAVKSTLRAFTQELNQWFVEHYRTDLYVASGWIACSADDLTNRGDDKRRYPMLYARLSRILSDAKATRYDAQTIRSLNFGVEVAFDHSRECSECHRSDLGIVEDDKCPLCASLGIISASLVNKDVFVIERARDKRDQARPTLALPFGCRLRMCAADDHQLASSDALRVYAKGSSAPMRGSAVRIWMGDYTADTQGKGIEAYALCGATLEPGTGIRRLGVLRADIDDLGAIFAFGLPDALACICRTTTLSRSLSMFFKSSINDVLECANLQVQIIYSGGDDLFIIGNWSDVIRAAIDVRNAFGEYTGNGRVTLSAGIGMFGKSYPVARMAEETGDLEEAAKNHTGADGPKNAVALWSLTSVFGWSEFVEGVEPLMHRVAGVLAHNEKGSAFVYNLVDLLRRYDEAASAPRLAYLLARAFEADEQNGGEVARELYALAQDETERRRLAAALEWYACTVRERGDQ